MNIYKPQFTTNKIADTRDIYGHEWAHVGCTSVHPNWESLGGMPPRKIFKNWTLQNNIWSQQEYITMWILLVPVLLTQLHDQESCVSLSTQRLTQAYTEPLNTLRVSVHRDQVTQAYMARVTQYRKSQYTESLNIQRIVTQYRKSHSRQKLACLYVAHLGRSY